MMNIYEIDSRIVELVDPETGEIQDLAALDELQMKRSQKIDNLIKLYQNCADDEAMIDEEIARLERRQEAFRRRTEQVKSYLDHVLGGVGYRGTTATIYYRNVESIQVSDEKAFREWAVKNGHDDLLAKPTPPKPCKTNIRKLLQAGENIPYCSVEAKNIMSIRG